MTLMATAAGAEGNGHANASNPNLSTIAVLVSAISSCVFKGIRSIYVVMSKIHIGHLLSAWAILSREC